MEMGESAKPDSTALATTRTNFAKFRTSLALDRTTLAWIRTALTFATFGFGMVGFFRTIAQAKPTEAAIRVHQAAIRFGVTLIAVGFVALVLICITHSISLRRLRRDEPLLVVQWPMSITIALLTALLGLYALWSVLGF